MKTLVKFLSIIVIGFIVCICIIYLININIMTDEMNNACKVSIESCQNIVKSKIIDDHLGLDCSDYPIYDDESYKDNFISSFNGLVSNKDLYDLDVKCNFENGLLAVYVHNNYSSFIKDKKIVNIIEVCE